MMDTDLGPLPKDDDNSELEERGLNALRNALPTELFLIREERIKDRGVDVSLEARHNNRATNFRSQCQLKSTEVPISHPDGSVSVRVPTHNFNYLCNSRGSIYFLYCAKTESIWFSWVDDARRLIIGKHIQWLKQDTITLHFRERLSRKNAKKIYSRLLRTGRALRKLSTERDFELEEELKKVVGGQDIDTLLKMMSTPDERDIHWNNRYSLIYFHISVNRRGDCNVYTECKGVHLRGGKMNLWRDVNVASGLAQNKKLGLKAWDISSCRRKRLKSSIVGSPPSVDKKKICVIHLNPAVEEGNEFHIAYEYTWQSVFTDDIHSDGINFLYYPVGVDSFEYVVDLPYKARGVRLFEIINGRLVRSKKPVAVCNLQHSRYRYSFSASHPVIEGFIIEWVRPNS